MGITVYSALWQMQIFGSSTEPNFTFSADDDFWVVRALPESWDQGLGPRSEVRIEAQE